MRRKDCLGIVGIAGLNLPRILDYTRVCSWIGGQGYQTRTALLPGLVGSGGLNLP
jgi:hypothetical protein